MENLNNPNFNRVEFDPLLSESGKNSFTMSPTRWGNEFNAVGIMDNNELIKLIDEFKKISLSN